MSNRRNGVVSSLVASLGLVWFTGKVEAQQRRPQPNGIRIQKVDAADDGSWLTVPDHHYLGSPTFSRDGEWIAFDAYRSDTEQVTCEVWIARRNGTEAKRLAVGATPRWHPDGRRLIFMREQRNDVENVPLGIFTIDRDGGNETFICPGRWPDWSPDGTQIAFSLGADDTRRGGSAELSRVYVAQADGTLPKPIAYGDCPSWSPDGSKLACCYTDAAMPAPLIRIVDLVNKNQRFAGYGWYRANWDKPGRAIVFNGVTDDREQGMVSVTLGAALHPVALETGVENASSPSYSADGKYIAFTAPH